ncbi:Nucleolar protein isoform 1 [Schistosoma japonicum]|uniref:Nucleolar protein isoform 1 n=1 Tax=Schistosoma japonicum TaxID=6182 RepID=A0A4Z2DBY3_SCHJA|nr:Nucleolar protein isoform 1 [Schistosoma japonicum]
MISSSVICEPFNSDNQYSELKPSESNTTNTITSTSNITDITDPIIDTTICNDSESSIVPGSSSSSNNNNNNNNNCTNSLPPIRCKSLEIKSTEKSLTNPTSKKRHRSTIDNQWNHSNSMMNTLTNLKYHQQHHSKGDLCLLSNEEQKDQEDCCNIDVKKRKTLGNSMHQMNSNSLDESIYNYTTNKPYELIANHSKLKLFNQRMATINQQIYSYPFNACKQNENHDELINELLPINHVKLKQTIKKYSTHNNNTTTVTTTTMTTTTTTASTTTTMTTTTISNTTTTENYDVMNDKIKVNNYEDELDNELTSASELTTAAYNNFVRRVVDDTLDRTVTFCEQPRHAITALENICTRAWPQLEVKRHRNRIRAYLKACRRNSKKNKGQINMKEPPANGLSIEARQLVSKALTLVAGDLDYLKQTMQVEKAKNDSLFPSKVDSSSEKSYSASSSKRSPNHHLKVDYSTTINNSELTDVYYNQKYDPYEMNSFNDKLKHTTNNSNNKNLWNVSNTLLNDIMNKASFPHTDSLFWSNSFLQNNNLDASYLATAAAAAAATAMTAVNPVNILKLLPAALQLNNNNNNINSYSSLSSSSTTSPFIPSSILPTSPRLLLHNDSMKDANINISSNSNGYDVRHDKLSIQNKHSTRKLSSHTSLFDSDRIYQMHQFSNNDNNNSNNCIDSNSNGVNSDFNEYKYLSSDKHYDIGSESNKQSNLINFYNSYFINDSNSNNHDSAYCLPPPAHIGSIHYSPLTNQILDRLMDTTLLTHNDIEFFLQNLELTKIAIKQARCQSYLILKKIEIVENHLHTTSTNSIMMPLNLS